MDLLRGIDWIGIAYAMALLVIGFIIAKQVSLMTERAVCKRFSRHQALLLKRLIFYVLLFLFIFSALQQLGFKITVLLGAAGVFTVALSFASQTAASNLVSGIFLLFECPFKVGDTIKIKEMTGTVDSMDLLSTKIKTFDNIRIRIPNETIVKSEIQNMTFYKTRRVDMLISVAYNSDIEKVKNVLLIVIKKNKYVLDEPVPQVIINNFADSAIELKIMIWAETKNVAAARNELNDAIKKRFDQEEIEMPYPQLTLHQV